MKSCDGQEWFQMRRATQNKLMKPKEIFPMDLRINEVMADFIPYIDNICDENGCIADLYSELNKLSYETICYVLYNERYGLLQQTCKEEALLFIKSVKEMMYYLGPLIVSSAELHKKFNTKQWQNHTKAWDNIFLTVKRCIDKSLAQNSVGKRDHLLHVINSDNLLTRKQLYGIFAELQIGGVETTANSLMWIMLHLSRNKDVQQKLLEEIQSTCPSYQAPTASMLQSLPYLKSCIKESMRLTPTVPFTSRTLEEDTNIGGYLIPQGTIAMINFHAMTWNDEFFPHAQEYKPERWMKDKHTINPFAHTPFGIGKRMCIGRRLAELQLQLTLCWLVKNFHINAIDEEPVKAIVSGLMIPARELPVSLKRRSNLSFRDRFLENYTQ
ncbi:1,25-dihydroxyvitamin D(3) 24-hydroxylase, mitochondrial isoform X2 [Xenopus tropicalis]|uniref:1,25-dihydroxyvitamin D(3) 24-hydroxylase, mitochondrial isoform X2 n=1 Tax=Xenopus tropicalis TaxID=8364 RepID=A0A8J1JV65_XENTR|nr:1,25-dihydroxyvitamin D(3) 24-hydroxylase, mitochondrial isoform X2 [Xenopus tropicalis]